jgi:carboxylate-amine ligase
LGGQAGLQLLRADVNRDHNDARWLRERQGQERLLAEVIRQAALLFRGELPAR